MSNVVKTFFWGRTHSNTVFWGWAHGPPSTYEPLSSQAATTNRILVTFHGNIIGNKLLEPEINQRQRIIEFETDKLGYLTK